MTHHRHSRGRGGTRPVRLNVKVIVRVRGTGRLTKGEGGSYGLVVTEQGGCHEHDLASELTPLERLRELVLVVVRGRERERERERERVRM